MLTELTVILCLAGTPQEASRALAAASVAEDTHLDASVALALYRQIAADAAASPSERFHSGLGQVRCLRRLGDLEPARTQFAQVAILAAMRADWMVLVEQERAHLEGAAPQEDPVKKQLLEALNLQPREFTARLAPLGRTILPYVRAILTGKLPEINTVSNPAVPMRFVDVLLGMQEPEIPGLLIEALEARALPAASRTQLLRSVASHAGNSGDQRFVELFVRGTMDPEPQVRSSAARALRDQPAIAWEVWDRLLSDDDESVRIEALSNLALAKGDYLRQAVEKLTSHPSSVTRVAVAQVLDPLQGKSREHAVVLARRLIADESPAVQMAALESTQRWRWSPTRELWDIGLRSSHAAVRQRSLSLLEKPQSDGERRRFAEFLRDPAPTVRQQAVLGLRGEFPNTLADIPGINVGLMQLLGDPSPDARFFALFVLARTADSSIADRIVPFLRDESGQVKALAFHYIDRLGLSQYADDVAASLPYQDVNSIYVDRSLQVGPVAITRWLLEVRGDAAAGAILDSLRANRNQSDDICGELANGLSPTAAPIVVERARAIQDPFVIQTLLRRLSRLLGSHPSAREYYLDLLQHADEAVRDHAATALGRFGTPEDLDRVISALLREHSAGVVHLLAVAVAAFAEDEHVERLARHRETSESPKERENCLAALALIQSPKATAVLLQALEQPGPERETILATLRRNKLESAFPVILRLLSENQLTDSERVSALEALGTFGRRESIPVLMQMLKEYPSLRRRQPLHLLDLGNSTKQSPVHVHPAMFATLEIGGEAAVAAGTSVLNGDFDASLRAQVMALMAFVPLPAADRLILDGLESTDTSVQKMAATAAGSALLVEAVPSLRRLLRSLEPQSRGAAERALERMAHFGIEVR